MRETPARGRLREPASGGTGLALRTTSSSLADLRLGFCLPSMRELPHAAVVPAYGMSAVWGQRRTGSEPSDATSEDACLQRDRCDFDNEMHLRGHDSNHDPPLRVVLEWVPEAS